MRLSEKTLELNFCSQFASAEGKKGGEFYTPRCVVKPSVPM